eukprot:CAMPEP_0174582226 /NCGR_PEP_ID=MMETSP0929-20130131/7101_1 /TAXON_ID=548131 ORGANISM="Ostreococcus mediterraneus, Strain clade-D-RCC2572" /NCGR_SAMPLE_ID=MMETSP0929 /ASSEMBLY_ACC=CAM_ASM_000573 /LENGTH=58 /DNA_ID=CAMNT_0015763957 /DNA_START=33 /DNA_END=205 /DNA_ORIENTATION=+
MTICDARAATTRRSPSVLPRTRSPHAPRVASRTRVRDQHRRAPHRVLRMPRREALGDV